LDSIQTSEQQKRRHAIESWDFNRRDPIVRSLFPELLESPEPLPSAAEAAPGAT
jgi:hypothetical protein